MWVWPIFVVVHVFRINRCLDDPWRTLSINSQESNSPQRNGSEIIPACNTSAQFPSFFGTTYPKQVHGADVFSVASDTQDEVDAYVKGVTLFSSALDLWLPCYSSAFSVGTNRDNSGQRLSSGKYSISFRRFWAVQRTDHVEIGRSLLTSIILGSFLSVILMWPSMDWIYIPFPSSDF